MSALTIKTVTIKPGDPEPAGMVFMSTDGTNRTYRETDAAICEKAGLPEGTKLSGNGEVAYMIRKDGERRKALVFNQKAIKAFLGAA